MHRRLILITLVCSMGAFGTGAFAQTGPPGPRPAFRPGGPGFGGELGLIGNKAGAPFSAHLITEFRQSLADGNQIDRKTTNAVYRDSQGRTRIEENLPAPPSGGSAATEQIVRINDPVAGFSYVLNVSRKTARKFPLPKWQPSANGQPPQRLNPGANVTTQSLGGQTIQGVYAEGTEITRSIPAGREGNSAPIQIVTTRWFSPDLGINVQTQTSDPRNGNTTVTLSDINRSEPDPSLFQLPSDYKVSSAGPRGRGFRSGPPPPAQ